MYSHTNDCQPELVPTELIWATIKNWFAEKKKTSEFNDAIHLADGKFAIKEDWTHRCEHWGLIDCVKTEGILYEGMYLGNDSDACIQTCDSRQQTLVCSHVQYHMSPFTFLPYV
jgi:hypothetical protein